MPAGFAECLSDPCSVKKRRGHSVGGAPEQRYQSLPVCAAAQIPTRAQDILVRKELGHMPGALIGMFKSGSRSKAGGVCLQPVVGATRHFRVDTD